MITARQLFESGYDLVWVVWGEHFIREALASIRLAMAAHGHMRNIGYKLVTYGDINNKAKNLLHLATEIGVEHQVRIADRPLNLEYLDLWKIRELSAVQRPTFYCDSDLVFFEDLLRVAPLDVFDCPTYFDFGHGDAQRCVKQVVGNYSIKPNNIDDCPYVDIQELKPCTGLLFAEHGYAIQSWLGKYERYTDRIASIYNHWFAEPLLSSMLAKGDIKMKMRHRKGIQEPLCNPEDYQDKVILETNGISITRAKHVHGYAVGHAWHRAGSAPERLEFTVNDDGNVVSSRCNLKTLDGLLIVGSIML